MSWVLGAETPCRGWQSPCPVPVLLPRAVLGRSWRGWAVRVLSPLTALCVWLLQLCCEGYWGRCCLCSFPSVARSVQERDWGWSNLCLVELSQALQAQPAGFGTPAENSCREYVHCELAAEPHIPVRAPQADSRTGSIVSCISALPYFSLALVRAPLHDILLLGCW